MISEVLVANPLLSDLSVLQRVCERVVKRGRVWAVGSWRLAVGGEKRSLTTEDLKEELQATVKLSAFPGRMDAHMEGGRPMPPDLSRPSSKRMMNAE